MGAVDGAVVVGVGGADVDPVAPGDDEERPSVAADRHDCGDGATHPVPRQRDMDALGGTQRLGVDALVEGAHLIGPHARRIDDDPGSNIHTIVETSAAEAAGGVLEKGGHAGVVRGDRAVVQDGGAGDGQGEARVVGMGIVVDEAGDQPGGVKGGHVVERLVAGDAPVELADARTTAEVVQPQRGAEGAGDRAVDHSVATEQGNQEGQDVDEVRGVAEQQLALGERLVDEAEVTLPEVADAAVDELRGA